MARTISLRDIPNRGLSPSITVSPRASGEHFGALEARALGQLGRAVSSLGSVGKKLAGQRQKAADDAYISDVKTRAKREFHRTEAEAKQQAPENFLGYAGDLRIALNERSGEIEAESAARFPASSFARSLGQDILKEHRFPFEVRAVTDEHNGQLAFYRGNVEANLGSIVADGVTTGDITGTLESGLATIEQNPDLFQGEEKAQRKAAFVAEATNEIVTNFATNHITDDPASVDAAVSEVDAALKKIPGLSPESHAKVKDALAGEVVERFVAANADKPETILAFRDDVLARQETSKPKPGETRKERRKRLNGQRHDETSTQSSVARYLEHNREKLDLITSDAEARLAEQDDREMGDIENATFDQGMSLYRDGKLDDAWIDQHSGFLGDTMEAALREAVRPGQRAWVGDDPVMDLTARSVAVGSLNGSLTAQEAQRLTQAQEFYESEEAPLWGARVRKTVMPENGHAAYRDAVFDFDAWAMTNPGATRAEAQAKAKELRTAAGMQVREDRLALVQQPRFLKGEIAALTPEALDDARNQTRDALAAGEISREEAIQEAAALKEYYQAVTGSVPPAYPQVQNFGSRTVDHISEFTDAELAEFKDEEDIPEFDEILGRRGGPRDLNARMQRDFERWAKRGIEEFLAPFFDGNVTDRERKEINDIMDAAGQMNIADAFDMMRALKEVQDDGGIGLPLSKREIAKIFRQLGEEETLADGHMGRGDFIARRDELLRDARSRKATRRQERAKGKNRPGFDTRPNPLDEPIGRNFGSRGVDDNILERDLSGANRDPLWVTERLQEFEKNSDGHAPQEQLDLLREELLKNGPGFDEFSDPRFDAAAENEDALRARIDKALKAPLTAKEKKKLDAMDGDRDKNEQEIRFERLKQFMKKDKK